MLNFREFVQLNETKLPDGSSWITLLGRKIHLSADGVIMSDGGGESRNENAGLV